jgi:hypothetical protein
MTKGTKQMRQPLSERPNAPQLLAIGLDAAEPSLIERWVVDGTLPHLPPLRLPYAPRDGWLGGEKAGTIGTASTTSGFAPEAGRLDRWRLGGAEGSRTPDF